MSSLVRTIRHALLAALLAVTAGVCPAAAQGQVQIEPGIPVDQTPAAGVRGLDRTIWFLDTAAARQL